ncbi:MAG TPA: hypothetical protein VFK04_12970 [Gemmatimonadaceae bacterium]|nr:hypothetical protein [Gemmatimonadaceae bacterium]
MPVQGISPNSNLITLGRGGLLLDRLSSAGALQGFNHAGDCDQISMSPTIEKITHNSSLSGVSTVYAEILKSTTWNITVRGFEMSKKNMALMMMGDEADFIQAADAAIADAALASAEIARLGGIYDTGHRNITVTGVNQGATALVEGVDYEVFSADAGLIRILPGSLTFVPATAVTWSGSAEAIAAGDLTVINGGTQGQIGCKGIYISDNPAGPQQELRFWKASLTPSGDFGFIAADTPISFTLTGVLQDDSAGNYGGSVQFPTHRLFYKG